MTTRPCDYFGGAAKTVLNKPLLEIYSTINATYAIGVNAVVHDNVHINEIPGASLNVGTGEITLPAGVYDVQAETAFRAGSVASNYHAVSLVFVDPSDNQILIGNRTSVRNDRNANTCHLHSQLTLSATTVIRQAMAVGSNATNAESGNTSVDIQKYSTCRIQKLDSHVDTPVISDPTMTLARPLMQVLYDSGSQYGEQILLAESGTWKDLQLNQTLINEISGASMAGNNVSLPAGEYFIEVRVPFRNIGPESVQITGALRDVSDDNVLLAGNQVGHRGDGSNDNMNATEVFSGRLTAAASLTFKLSGWIAAGADSGYVGHYTSDFPGAFRYQEIKIWQLDSLVRTPVLVNDKLYPLPGNVIVTGNMHGLEYEYTTVNTITVQAGICMDSTNEYALTLENQQIVSLTDRLGQAPLPSTVYNIFLTDTGAQTNNQIVDIDTDVNGANIVASNPSVKLRWIGFVRTNESANLVAVLWSRGNVMSQVPNEILTGATNAWVTVSLSNVFPPGRVVKFCVAAQQYQGVNLYFDSAGPNDATMSGSDRWNMASVTDSYGASNRRQTSVINYNDSFKMLSNEADRVIHLTQIEMKR